MSALISGMAGIMVASYGNEVTRSNFFINLCSMAIMTNPELLRAPEEYRQE
jgi:hypothetical protein